MFPHRAIVGLIIAAAIACLGLAGGGAPNVAGQTRDARADVGLANGQLHDLVRDDMRGIAGPTLLTMSGDSVRVEVLHHLSDSEIREVVGRVGGNVYGDVPGQLVEATVPVKRLVELQAQPGVDYVRPPQRVDVPIDDEPDVGAGSAAPQGVPIVGEEVAKTNVDAWHDADFLGRNIKIGIVDVFNLDAWNAAVVAGEVPSPSGTFCRVLGNNCNLWDAEELHGVAVAEIIREMAPRAKVYLATAGTTSDLQAAVDYFKSKGVQIITRSLTSEFDGPGDGTGPMAAVIDSAISKGMLWVNAAGNAASPGGATFGSYWRGNWNDPDGNGVMNFQDGSESLLISCGFINGLRWSDWGPAKTDYDVEIYDSPFDTEPKVVSQNSQTLGAPPIELTDSLEPFTCSSSLDFDLLKIKLVDPGNGTGDDVLELMGNRVLFGISQNPYSASGPASDSNNVGMLSVGAIDPPDGSDIAGYSSWGPTNSDRIKPDLSAASCVASFTYFPDCFNGTSAAAPVVAGAAAVILGSDALSVAGFNPVTAVAAYLRQATVDRGDSGTDNIYGIGELILPDLRATPTPTATPGPGQFTWGDFDCGGSIAPRDEQAVLNYFLQQGGLSQTQPCHIMGAKVTIDGVTRTWGDVDCNGSAAPRDGQAILKHFLQQNELSQTQPCPIVGSQITITG